MHHQADKTPTPRFKPYKGAAGGWGALISVTQHWLGSDNALKNLRMMLKTNQNGGFDCPGCAWGDSPESGMVKFCENGAKAVNWEATKRRVDAKFFAKHSVTALLEQSDYWLEYQGRLTEPMVYDAETDRYKPISWEDAFALIGKHFAICRARIRPSFTPPVAPATKRRICISCSYAPMAPTISLTARTCATRPAVWRWRKVSASAKAR
jgi:anaerobic selenocysteine-containing dehydrogenase